MARIKATGRYPDAEDVKGAIRSLARLEKIYNWQLDLVARGKLEDLDDCPELSCKCDFAPVTSVISSFNAFVFAKPTTATKSGFTGAMKKTIDGRARGCAKPYAENKKTKWTLTN